MKRQPIIPVGPSIAYIPLTQGRYALIDAEDAQSLGAWNWCAYWAKSTSCFYAMRGENKGRKRSIRMHAQILDLVGHSTLTADHIVSGNGLDNRRCNLRPATRREQCLNRRIAKNSSSGVTGVSWHSYHKKWQAYSYVNRKMVRLGYFSQKDDAIRARAVYEESL